jgi:hypothetical protein
MTRTYLDSFNRPAEPPEPEVLSDCDIVSLALQKYSHWSDGIQIHDDQEISHSDRGAWVKAWIWVPYPENDS